MTEPVSNGSEKFPDLPSPLRRACTWAGSVTVVFAAAGALVASVVSQPFATVKDHQKGSAKGPTTTKPTIELRFPTGGALADDPNDMAAQPGEHGLSDGGATTDSTSPPAASPTTRPANSSAATVTTTPRPAAQPAPGSPAAPARSPAAPPTTTRLTPQAAPFELLVVLAHSNDDGRDLMSHDAAVAAMNALAGYMTRQGTPTVPGAIHHITIDRPT